MAYCIYRSEDGTYFHATNTLTDDEIHAYKLHPETFFAVVKDDQSAKQKLWLTGSNFFFKSYQHTSKEKLLELWPVRRTLGNWRSNRSATLPSRIASAWPSTPIAETR